MCLHSEAALLGVALYLDWWISPLWNALYLVSNVLRLHPQGSKMERSDRLMGGALSFVNASVVGQGCSDISSCIIFITLHGLVECDARCSWMPLCSARHDTFTSLSWRTSITSGCGARRQSMHKKAITGKQASEWRHWQRGLPHLLRPALAPAAQGQELLL